MSIIVKVSEWGNSLAVRLPKAVTDQLGLTAGSEAEMTLEGGEMRFKSKPRQRPRKKLEEMVADMRRLKAAGIEEPELVDWGPDVGKEILPDDDWSEEYAAWEKTQRNAG